MPKIRSDLFLNRVNFSISKRLIQRRGLKGAPTQRFVCLNIPSESLGRKSSF